MRREEVECVMSRFAGLPFVDQRFIVLAGVSEGAVTAGIWPSHAITARMAMAWNCEPGYFVEHANMGGNPDQTPFLNLMGYADNFFGPHAELSERYNVAGHGAEALKDFKRAKVIIYPTAGHRILEHAETQYDVVHFLEQWRDYYLNGTL